MYKFIVRRIVRRAFQALSKGDHGPVLKTFRPNSRFMFAGDHALAGERRGTEQVRAFFDETFRRFPGIQIVPQEILVNGWPWNTVVATHLKISAPRAGGRQYRNEGMQLLRLSWGRVVEDLIFEDTQEIAAELHRTEHSEPGRPITAGR